MVIDCLQGLVGVKGRDTGVQVYINTLPGISMLDFEKAINNESKSAYERVNELISLAIQEVQQDVRTAMEGNFELKSIIDNDVIGYFWENQVIIPQPAGNLTGMQIRCSLSPYMKLFLNRLRLFVNHTGTVNVQVWDLIQGIKLQNINVATTAGQIAEVNPDWDFATNKQRMDLFIGYETGIDSFETMLTAYKDDEEYNLPGGWMFVRGATIADSAPKLWQNLNGNSGTSGISFDYSLQCTFDEKLCNMKKLLAVPIQYKVGSLIMKEMKYSKRLNGIITAYTSNHDELMNDYNNEYMLRMRQLLQNVDMPRDICFCDATLVQPKVVLP